METKITIAADVNGDIPEGLADEYGIVILPQYYRFDRDDTVYGDERNLSSAEFFARLSGGERAYSMGCNPQRVRELQGAAAGGRGGYHLPYVFFRFERQL